MVALFNIESVPTNFSPRHRITFICPQERLTVTTWRLGGPHSHSGRFGEEKYFLPSTGIRSPLYPALGLFAIPTEPSCLLVTE